MDIFGSHTWCNEHYFTDYTHLYWNTIMSFDGEGFVGGLFGFGLIIAGLSIFMACLDWINRVTGTNIGLTILLITIILYAVVGFLWNV